MQNNGHEIQIVHEILQPILKEIFCELNTYSNFYAAKFEL